MDAATDADTSREPPATTGMDSGSESVDTPDSNEPSMMTDPDGAAVAPMDSATSEAEPEGPPKNDGGSKPAETDPDSGPPADPKEDSGTTPIDSGTAVDSGPSAVECTGNHAAETPGDDCAFEIACGQAGTCDLRRNQCCWSYYGYDECNGGQVCNGNRLPVRCDGPEDCQGSEVCCFQEGAAVCAAECAVEDRLCHTASDCPGAECKAGRYDTVLRQDGWLYWGFCHTG